MKIKIGLVDDHQLFRKSLILLLASLPDFEVVMDANNGLDLQGKFKKGQPVPDIMLIDVEMPEMNGHETARWLHASYPTIRLVALSMNDKEQTIIDMIKAGCCSYLLKDTKPVELEHALKEVYSKSYYNSDLNKTSLAILMQSSHSGMAIQVGEREREFLQLASQDITYKQIALRMNLSERTIDGYRESLFAKFHVQSRTGMVMEAIRRGLVKV